MATVSEIELPGLDCGLCGFPSCDEMAARLAEKPDLLKRCIPLSADSLGVRVGAADRRVGRRRQPVHGAGARPGRRLVRSRRRLRRLRRRRRRRDRDQEDAARRRRRRTGLGSGIERTWTDHLGREVDFVLDSFPEEVGPREQVIPHNPVLTRELDIQVGEVLVGRPLGISCGCPVTHCGIVQSVDIEELHDGVVRHRPAAPAPARASRTSATTPPRRTRA